MPATYTDRLDGLTTSVAVKGPCRVATTAAITLSGLQTIDGVTVAENDRVLVKDQANSITNGIYQVHSTTWVRSLDFNGSRDAVGATQVRVAEGSTNADTTWEVDGTGIIVFEVDNIDWVLVDSGGSIGSQEESIIVACSNQTTSITAGTGKNSFPMPYAFTLSEVRAMVDDAPTGSDIIIDINQDGVSILSTKLTIDANETSSTTAAVPAVISDATLTDDAKISVDFDQVGSTNAGKGVKVVLIGTQT